MGFSVGEVEHFEALIAFVRSLSIKDEFSDLSLSLSLLRELIARVCLICAKRKVRPREVVMQGFSNMFSAVSDAMFCLFYER